MHVFSRRLLLTMAVAVLVALPAAAGDKKVEERYTALGVAMGSAATGAKSPVTFGITGWTSPEDRERLLGVLMEKGPGELKSALFKQDSVGFVKLGSSLGYPLRYAWESEVDGKRRIILATERAVKVTEIYRASRSRDFDITLIEILVNEDGTGEGSLAAAVELSVKENRLEIKTLSSEPVRLMNLRREKK